MSEESSMENTSEKRRASAGRAPEKKPGKRRRRRSPVRLVAMAVALVAVLGGTFALGWHFGVESTRYHGDILLVNSEHRLPADYVPEGLVNLYEQRHSFRLARSDIYLTRETYEAMEAMFAAAEADGVNGFIVTSGYRDYEPARLRSTPRASRGWRRSPARANIRPGWPSTSPPRRARGSRAPSSTRGCARTRTSTGLSSAIRRTRPTRRASTMSRGTIAMSASRPRRASARRTSRWRRSSNKTDSRGVHPRGGHHAGGVHRTKRIAAMRRAEFRRHGWPTARGRRFAARPEGSGGKVKMWRG